MATITFFSNMRAFANALSSKSGQIRDAIENVGEDPRSGGSSSIDRPPLIDKMISQLSNVEDHGGNLIRKTIDAKSSVPSSRIVDIATRLQRRCASEMTAVETFLKQYGYQRNFAESHEKLAEDTSEAMAPADADTAVPEATGVPNPSSAVPPSETATDLTIAYSSPTRAGTGGDDINEDEGDISTVQKEPRPSATPARLVDEDEDERPTPPTNPTNRLTTRPRPFSSFASA